MTFFREQIKLGVVPKFLSAWEERKKNAGCGLQMGFVYTQADTMPIKPLNYFLS